ncbi:MAG: hypothetical protein ACOC3A_11475 [Thermodesulfobacteriota bacterium]
MDKHSTLTTRITEHIESTHGVKAGIAVLSEVLEGASYRAEAEAWKTAASLDGEPDPTWPADARSVLVLGLPHPEEAPRLDWWSRGNTLGNRKLMEISDQVIAFLGDRFGLGAVQLPYYVERGGVFLKDAAVLAGLGIVGRNNLFLHPELGPRIRLRGILVEADLAPTRLREPFSPCETCDEPCRRACPMKAFENGAYSRQRCGGQMRLNERHPAPDPAAGENGSGDLVIQYCRKCELSCPVGA